MLVGVATLSIMIFIGLPERAFISMSIAPTSTSTGDG